MAIFGVKRGGDHEFCHQSGTAPVPSYSSRAFIPY